MTTQLLDIEQTALLAEARELLPYLSKEGEEAPIAASLGAAIDATDWDAMSDAVHDAKHMLYMTCGNCGDDLDCEPRSSWAYCSQDCYFRDGGDL
jgi:hypothetical protein